MSRRKSTAPAWCSTRSAGRSTTTPAAARSSITSTTIWCRSVSSSISTTRTRTSSVRGISALQDPSAGARDLRRRQAPLLWRTRHHRRRLPVGAETLVPRRRADRLRSGLRQRAAHQGQPQRDAVRMLAAEHVADALAEGRSNDEISSYDAAWPEIDIGADLWKVRNAKPLWSRFGTLLGFVLGGFDMWCNTLGFSLFGTLKSRQAGQRSCGRLGIHADRISETRRQAHLRPALLGVPLEHQS